MQQYNDRRLLVVVVVSAALVFVDVVVAVLPVVVVWMTSFENSVVTKKVVDGGDAIRPRLFRRFDHEP